LSEVKILEKTERWWVNKTNRQ